MPANVPPSFDAARMTRLRSRLQGYMQDSCTITRTGLTVPCLLMADTRETHPSGQPDFARLRRWRIATPNGTDVRTSDTMTLAGPTGPMAVSKGLYVAVDVISGSTFSARTLAYAMRVRRADGTLDLYTNTVATFERPSTDAKITNVPMYYGAVSHDVFLRPYAANFTYMLMWDAAVVFGDGTTPGNGDMVLLPFLARGRAALAYVEPPGAMAQPVVTAFIKDAP